MQAQSSKSACINHVTVTFGSNLLWVCLLYLMHIHYRQVLHSLLQLLALLHNMWFRLDHVVRKFWPMRLKMGMSVPSLHRKRPSGGDYRCAENQVLAHHKGRANRNIVLLVQNSSLRKWWQLHNLTWLHRELCQFLTSSCISQQAV